MNGPDLDEPLGESAPLAHEWAQHLCPNLSAEPEGCDWYHGSWQYLRLLGVFESIRSDDDFLLPALRRLIEGGARRFLVSGAADYALLARIRAAAGPQAAALEVTVADRCRTPLELNAWYARRAGLRLKTVQADVLAPPLPARYDVICTHSFLCFFTAEQREELLRRWHTGLLPGGRVLTAQRVRAGDRDSRIHYLPEQVAALVQKARDLAEASPALGVSPERAARLAEGYARNHWTHLIAHPDELRQPFLKAGFELEVFEPPGERPTVLDTPGTPNAQGSVRWRIQARRGDN
ncbi:MAG: class I SAM-dependent methyltransferase [Wenzhouxiangellaceae bacterium]